MVTNGYQCADSSWAWTSGSQCSDSNTWVSNSWCQYSCSANGKGYGGGACCPLAPPSPPPCQQCTDVPSPYLATNGLQCADFSWAWTSGSGCSDGNNWVSNNYCQYSCAANGKGYGGLSCCPLPPVSPPPADLAISNAGGAGNEANSQSGGSGDSNPVTGVAIAGGILAGICFLLGAVYAVRVQNGGGSRLLSERPVVTEMSLAGKNYDKGGKKTDAEQPN